MIPLVRPTTMLAILPLLLALPLLAAAAPSRLSRSDLAPAKRATLPAGWSAEGCMQDGSTRLLQGYQSSTGTNTVENCIAACSSNGYVGLREVFLDWR